jgi:hypothetical protein
MKMRLDLDLLLQVVRECNNDELHLTVPPPHFGKWIEERSLPEDLGNFLKSTAFSTEMSIGAATLHDFRGVRAWDHDFPSFIDQGLICVGAAIDGNPVVIDFQENGRTGFVSQDQPYYEPDAQLRSMFRSVSPSLGEFAVSCRAGC